MRELTDHIVENDSANHQLNIKVLDEPGLGGACHHYAIEGFNSSTNPSDKYASDDVSGSQRSTIFFQNGPIKEVGVNGITHEALLAILIDRLRSFQDGPYACRENAVALTHLGLALHMLQDRTRARIQRGVEGTTQK